MKTMLVITHLMGGQVIDTDALDAANEEIADGENLEAGLLRALTRQDIALALYSRLGTITHREAKRLTDSVIDEIVDTLASGESLKLHDFGSFVVRSKNERAGRNPRTGEPVTIQARRIVVFKASPNMKAIVNGEQPATSEKKREKPKREKGGAAPTVRRINSNDNNARAAAQA